MIHSFGMTVVFSGGPAVVLEPEGAAIVTLWQRKDKDYLHGNMYDAVA